MATSYKKHGYSWEMVIDRLFLINMGGRWQRTRRPIVVALEQAAIVRQQFAKTTDRDTRTRLFWMHDGYVRKAQDYRYDIRRGAAA